MKINHVGEQVYSAEDVFDLAMQGHDVLNYQSMIVDSTVDIGGLIDLLENSGNLQCWQDQTDPGVSVEDFDRANQHCWYMPEHYKTLDIASHVLDLCETEAELQRAGQELLMYQERGMFDLLRYLVYLVSVMTEHNIIWGVGRGSCVASFVLYKLGVHRVNSLYYDLDPAEFLR